jgi:Lon protease-like protein
MSESSWPDADDDHPPQPATASLAAVPLFPLPNVVLFPRAVLPLHIFEQRYKQMTADVLAGDRQIAMALLRPGWEKTYWSRPEIEPVVCVGSILSHEKLPDGKYNFLLQGTVRARIVRELKSPGGIHRPYRVATLEPLPLTQPLEIDTEPQRRRLLELFSATDAFASTSLARQFRKLLADPMLRTGDVADLVAFTYFEDVELKQSLLAEGDVLRRIQAVIAELQALRPRVKPAAHRPDPGKPNWN